MISKVQGGMQSEGWYASLFEVRVTFYGGVILWRSSVHGKHITSTAHLGSQLAGDPLTSWNRRCDVQS